jgi:hypothetical protein
MPSRSPRDQLLTLPRIYDRILQVKFNRFAKLEIVVTRAPAPYRTLSSPMYT